MRSDYLDAVSWPASAVLLLVGGYVGAEEGGLGTAVVCGSVGALTGFAIPALVYRFREVGLVALALAGAIGAVYAGYQLWFAI